MIDIGQHMRAATAASDALPTVSFPRLWHVGSLEPSAKRDGSYEGACLSVSRCPGAWREISDGLVGGDTWVADATNVHLLDAHALDDKARADVLAWGCALGYAEKATLWRVSRFDDELDDTVTMTLADRCEAIGEMDHDEEDPDYDARIAEGLSEVTEHRSLPTLVSVTRGHGELLGDASVLDALLPLWVEAGTDLAGVWWNDRFDLLCHSAPRGGIIPSRTNRLAFQRTADEPYDLCDAEDDEDDPKDQ